MNDMDKLLKQALEEMVKEDYESRPKELPEHQFSVKFRRKMKQVFRMLESQEGNGANKSSDSLLELYRPIRSKRKWIALALLILMLVGGSVIAAEPIKQWLNGFRIEKTEDHVRIQNDEAQEDVGEDRGEFRKYRLTELPKGYSLQEEKFDKGFNRYFITYSDTEDIISLKQTWQDDESPEKLTSNAVYLKEAEVNGFTGYYTEDSEMGTLILSNGVYKLVLDGPFSREELLELAGKLELVDEPM